MTDAAPAARSLPPRQTLSPLGWVGVLAAAAVFTAGVALRVEGGGLRQSVERLAQQVLRDAEALVDEVDAELDAVALSTSPAQGCPEHVREVLLRASLRSGVAQAFVRVSPDGAACGPSASQAFVDAVDPEAVSGQARTGGAGLLLRPAAGLAGGLVAARAFEDGSAIAAKLEPRRVREQIGEAARRAGDPAFVLRTGEPGTNRLELSAGGAAVRADAAGPGREPAGDRLDAALFRSSVASARWPLEVVAHADAGDLADRLGRSAPTWLLLAALLAVGLLAWSHERIGRRDRPEDRLRRALRKRRFEPVVQPIVDARTGACVGAEVLLRWVHPVRGLVSPVEFIDLAEATGLIVPISDLLVSKARDQLTPIARRHPDLYFSFNIAPAQLRDPQLAERLAQAFDETSLPVGRVLLEITERDAVDEDALRGLEALRARGMRLAIDDFGTGHSSLAALERLQVDRIKFDREFVRRIDQPGATLVVLDAMIALGQRLGTPVIAEGVETEAQWRWLAERGVEYLQGYLFARPMPIAEFARWLERAGAISAPPVATSAPVGRPRGEPAPGPIAALVGGLLPAAGLRVAEIDLERLCAAMRGADGLDVRDRSWRLTTWRQCFVGAEAVDWMGARLGLDRTQAVRLGQRMAANGLFEHVAQEHDFADAPLFYRFIERTDAEPAIAPAAASTDLRALVREMRGPSGLALRAHDWRGVRYRDTFTGGQACAWIGRRLGVGRDEAETVGRALLRMGAIRHVDDERPWRAGREPFRFG